MKCEPCGGDPNMGFGDSHLPIRPKTILSNEGERSPVEEEEVEDGVRRPTTKRRAMEPTAAEIEEHNITHLPYRNWCPVCVKARGKEDAHRREERQPIARVHIDYWFMRDKRGGDLIPVAAMKDETNKVFKAHIVPMKGNVDMVAEKLALDIEDMGHKDEVTVKSDQEPALLDLVNAIAKSRRGITHKEKAKARDSQSNGTAERAVQSVEGMVRTMKLDLEEKLGVPIPCAHPIMSWMVEHAAETLNRYLVGEDGKTPYERLRGKKYRGEMYEFGRWMMHRFPGKPEGGSMQPRWAEGVWLGKAVSSDEHVIGMADGTIVKARSVTRKMESQSWNREAVLGVSVPSWKGARRAGEEVRRAEGAVEGAARVLDMPEVEEGPARATASYEPVPRDLYVKPQNLQDFGYTKDCKKCDAIRHGSGALAHRSHSTTCRERIRDCLQKSEIEKQRQKEKEDRKNEHIARIVERDQERTRREEKTKGGSGR